MLLVKFMLLVNLVNNLWIYLMLFMDSKIKWPRYFILSNLELNAIRVYFFGCI